MKKIIFLFSLTLSFNLLAACEWPVKEINACAQIKWQLGPKYGIFSKALVSLSTKDGKALSKDEELEIYPWMIMEGGHEHGSRETVIKKVSPGIYEVSMIHLTKMPGKWYLRLKRPGAKARDEYLASLPIQIQ